MKTTLTVILGALASLVVSTAAQAAYIAPLPYNHFNLDAEAPGGYTSYSHPLSNFDTMTKNHKIGTFAHPNFLDGKQTPIDGYLWGSNTYIRNGGHGPDYAAPALGLDKFNHTVYDTTNYMAVQAGGYAVFSLTAPAHYFGFLWGSVDSYNTISFFDKVGQLLATFTGKDMPNDDGKTGVGGTFYANFTSTREIWKVVLSSTCNAFEIDDVRVSSVPVPAALPMFGAALAGLGAVSRRRRKKVPTA